MKTSSTEPGQKLLEIDRGPSIPADRRFCGEGGAAAVDAVPGAGARASTSLVDVTTDAGPHFFHFEN
jgi:hypothetical protein